MAFEARAHPGKNVGTKRNKQREPPGFVAACRPRDVATLAANHERRSSPQPMLGRGRIETETAASTRKHRPSHTVRISLTCSAEDDFSSAGG